MKCIEHVEICDVSCVLVKTVKTQKQIKYKKEKCLELQGRINLTFHYAILNSYAPTTFGLLNTSQQNLTAICKNYQLSPD